MRECDVIAALVMAFDLPTLDTAIKRGRVEVTKSRKRSCISAPRPRAGKYGFGEMIGNDAGKVFEVAEYGVAVGYIIDSARSFAQRWNLVFTYDRQSAERVHVWLKRPNWITGPTLIAPTSAVTTET